MIKVKGKEKGWKRKRIGRTSERREQWNLDKSEGKERRERREEKEGKEEQK